MTALLGSVLLLVSGAMAAEPEYCAFEVNVASPGGVPVRGTNVELLQDGVRFAMTATDARGRARICDSPPGLVDVRVGGRLCGAVTVGYLQAWWLKTRPVFVTYSNCSGEEWVRIGACRVTLRIRDRSGEPVSGAAISEGGATEKSAPAQVSDSLGRVFLRLGYGTSFSGTILKNGYLPSQLNEECQRGKTDPRDVFVTLQHADGAVR